MASNVASPDGLLAALACEPDANVRSAVAGNSGAPLPLILRLLLDDDEGVRKAATHNDNAQKSSELIHEVMATGLDVHYPQSEVQALAFLVKDRDGERCLSALSWGGITRETLGILAFSRWGKVRTKVASTAWASPEVFAILSYFPETQVLCASSRNTSPVTLEELWSGFEPRVGLALALAANDATPSNILAELSRFPDLFVRDAVASNCSTDVDTLGDLAEAEFLIVVRKVAKNPNTPSFVLRYIAQRFIPYMRNQGRGMNRQIFAGGGPTHFGEQVLFRTSQASATYAWNTESSAYEILQAVSSNPQTPSDVLQSMLELGHELRPSIAQNVNATEEILSRMAADIRPFGYDEDDEIVDDSELSEMIERHMNTPQGVREQLSWHRGM